MDFANKTHLVIPEIRWIGAIPILGWDRERRDSDGTANSRIFPSTLAVPFEERSNDNSSHFTFGKSGLFCLKAGSPQREPLTGPLESDGFRNKAFRPPGTFTENYKGNCDFIFVRMACSRVMESLDNGMSLRRIHDLAVGRSELSRTQSLLTVKRITEKNVAGQQHCFSLESICNVRSSSKIN